MLEHIEVKEGRPDEPAGPVAGRDNSAENRERRTKIRCPKCTWEHDWNPHWGCERCHAIFDTFVTRATCPDCAKTWADTLCPSCSRWSRHDDWYCEDD